jgi:hypothetical protein
MIKNAYIKKIDEKTWRVYSQKGKNLGTFKSLKAAKDHLQEVEFFKNKDLNKNARSDFYQKIIEAKEHNHKHHKHHKHDEESTYSALLRKINKENPENIKKVMSNFKKIFENALKDETPLDEIEKVCLLELQAKNKSKVEDE